jgi:hypothetical protein
MSDGPGFHSQFKSNLPVPFSRDQKFESGDFLVREIHGAGLRIQEVPDHLYQSFRRFKV